MRFVQFRDPSTGARGVGCLGDDDRVVDLTAQQPELDSVFALLRACGETPLSAWVAEQFSLDEARADDGVLLPPIDQPDNPWALQLWGAGVTHKRSAEAREAEAVRVAGKAATIYDKMYRAGLEGAKPEIFFKGNGHHVVGPEEPLERAKSARRLAPEPELVAFYVAGAGGEPRLVGFSGGNDFSDQGWESENPLYLVHAKVQDGLASIGPILVTPDDPGLDLAEVRVRCRVLRDGELRLDSGPLVTGERHMAHTLNHLCGHLFDHRRIQSDEVRGLYLGTSAVFDLPVEAGDRIEIAYDSGLGTLVNPVIHAPS